MSMPSSSTIVSSAPDSSSPSSQPDRPLGFTNSSNLYLITFLATLFLLLFISCTIVLRSFVLRRRYQRQIDEALAAGIILAPRAQGSRKRRYGHKPKMFTSWVVQGGERWDEMMPVAALPVQAKRRLKNANRASSKHQPPDHPQPTDTTSSPTSEPPPLRQRFLRAFRPRGQIRSEPPAAVQPETPARTRVDMLQISVLIAMPTPNRPTNSSTSSFQKTPDEDEPIPDVVFGVTRLPYKHPNPVT
ncbi:hypothetical protein LshimejAT787_0503640 [Lyophyllum shimeji]|uniref:Transmembrane protein n=1 Tax=Lyophyllum shimeji TaxID=47721 RepID=A0A9P3UKU0_LYOSH|nr:hypothetical protein LshimejAT787_0503640 [Lyophyllum shimeji]